MCCLKKCYMSGTSSIHAFSAGIRSANCQHISHHQQAELKFRRSFNYQRKAAIQRKQDNKKAEERHSPILIWVAAGFPLQVDILKPFKCVFSLHMR